MITEQDIEHAEQAYNQAEDALLDLGPARRRILPNRESGAIRAAAEGRVRLAAEQLEALVTQRDAERADLADRPKREQDAAKYLTAAGKELGASRDRVAGAAAAAQAALVELLDAGHAHEALVRSTAAEMAGRGLALDDGSGVDHETGGVRGSAGVAVRIRGVWSFGLRDPAALVAWVTYQVASARLPRVHALAGHVRWFGGAGLLGARTDGLLDGVPAVPPAELRERPVVRTPQVQGAPVHLSDVERDRLRRAGKAI